MHNESGSTVLLWETQASRRRSGCECPPASWRPPAASCPAPQPNSSACEGPCCWTARTDLRQSHSGRETRWQMQQIIDPTWSGTCKARTRQENPPWLGSNRTWSWDGLCRRAEGTRSACAFPNAGRSRDPEGGWEEKNKKHDYESQSFNICVQQQLCFQFFLRNI